jgi:hypothetical protein
MHLRGTAHADVHHQERQPAQPEERQRWFDARCKRYGVRRITVQDTRRTCGSLLAALDERPAGAGAAADVDDQGDPHSGGPAG